MNGGNETYGVLPPGVVSPTDHGGGLLIVDVITLTISLVSVGLRVYSSTHEGRRAFACYKDDLLCFLAGVRCCLPKIALDDR